MHAECGLRRVTADQLTEKRPLGEGGFGRVIRAWYRPWRMEVAIKMLHGASQTLDEDALREAELMSSLRFPHVVFLVGLYCHPEEPLGIVMEFLSLGSLASVQERLSLLPALRVRLIHEVALGMNYLHGLDTPLLHLDLNPRNVLLDGELHAKIADFGLSKLKQRSSGDSSCLVAGTLEYLPPECFDPGKDHYKPGPPTDIYSFGIIIWSILTGKQPYGAGALNNQTLIEMLIPKGQRPDLQELPAEGELEGLGVLTKLMAECWSNTPEKRPPFKDILVITEKVFQFHRGTILDAVHRVLSNLNSQPTSRTLSLRTADSIGSLRSEDSLRTDPQSQPPTSPQTDTEAREGEQRRALRPGPPVEGGATACPVREQEERMSAPLTVDHGSRPPPTATPGMRQECSEGRQQASAQRKLPEEPGCSAGTFSTGTMGEGVERGQYYKERGKITVLASRIEGLQIGNRNTMHIIRKSPKK